MSRATCFEYYCNKYFYCIAVMARFVPRVFFLAGTLLRVVLNDAALPAWLIWIFCTQLDYSKLVIAVF